jgi:hypothetical protein
MVDVAQLERTLDLWASLWQPRERAQFEHAIERVLRSGAPPSLKAAALAACWIIRTPRLLGAAERAAAAVDDQTLAEVMGLAEPRARLLGHAAHLAGDRTTVRLLVEKAVRDPHNRVADKLLDVIDIRDLYATMRTSFDDAVRTEAARRLKRRGPYQRARLLASVNLTGEGADEFLGVDAFEFEIALEVERSLSV